MNTQTNKPECCPEFNPEPWDDKIFTWENKMFIKDKVCTFLYMPLNFGKVIRRIMTKLEKSGAEVPENLCLSDHTSKWNMDIYIAVDKEVEDISNITLSGNFLTKVYEGNFKDTGKWCSDFENLAKNKGLEIKKWYMWYTTCPKCAKKYGKNYVVIFGQVN